MLEDLEETEQQFLRSKPSVSLAAILRQGQLDGDDMPKLLLSYLLAKAVWRFYESDWMTPHWTKDVIHFMRQKLDFVSNSHETLISIHMPHFRTEVRSSWFHHSPSEEPSDDLGLLERFPPDKGHPHPKVRALGILLLEIQLGRRNEDIYKESTQMQNSDSFDATRIINSPSWKEGRTYEALKDMIHICIRGATDDFGTNESSARAGVSTYVVEPLRKLFKLAFSSDQEPDSFHTDPVSLKSESPASEKSEALPLAKGTRVTCRVHESQRLGLTADRAPYLNENRGLVQGLPTAEPDIEGGEDRELCEVGFGCDTAESRYLSVYLQQPFNDPVLTDSQERKNRQLVQKIPRATR